MQEVGSRLKNLRESVKLSQVKIGELMGLKQSSINRYENGQAEAPYRILLWYADYFDVSIDYLFGRTDNPQGRLYKYEPKALKVTEENQEEMKKFVEMCFDPDSIMSTKLKETMLKMMGVDKT